MQLLVNIDHVATIRNARGEGYPDPVEAAIVSEQAGAAGIVFHLRADRRHIHDDDVYRLKESVKGVLNFEMAATREMIGICLDVQPDYCTLVPESREELTTEGGLNMTSVFDDFKSRVFPALKEAGIKISLFLDPVERDIELAAELGADTIEMHTGTYANAQSGIERDKELNRLQKAAEQIHSRGMIVNAGHGLNLDNLPAIVEHVPHLADVSIGHALISKSIFWGLDRTIGEYLKIMQSEA